MKTRPHIVHVTSSLKLGGAERVLVDLVRELEREGYRNTVLYFHDGPKRAELEQLGVQTIQVNGKFHRYDPLLFFVLWRRLRALKPDVIHSSLWAANFVARIMGKLMGIPVVNALHSRTNTAGQSRKVSEYTTVEQMNRDSAMRSILDKVTCHWAERYVLVSEQMKSFELPEGKVCVIPNGIHRPSDDHVQTRAALGIADDAFVVGAVGRFCSVKNFQLLLRSFRLVRKRQAHARLLLIGYGELEDDLRTITQECGIAESVYFIKTEHAHSYYPLFDCFAMTSFQEGLSMALLESMSCGIPPVIVAQDHELIEHEKNGLLVYAHDQVLLSIAIERLIMNPKLIAQLGENAQELVMNRYTTERMVTQYRELYHEVMNG